MPSGRSWTAEMALSCDGTDDHAQSGENYNNDNQLSVSFWANINSTGQAQFDRIFELGGFNSGDGGVGLEITSPVSLVNPIVWAGDGTSATIGATTSYTDDQWHHYLIVSNVTGPLSEFWQDGSSIGTNSSKTRGTTATQFTIGAHNNDTSQNQAQCIVAELAIWHGTILDDAEAAILAKGFSPLSVRPNNLVGYWPLIGGVGRGPISGDTLTVTNAVKAAHPAIIYPSSQRVAMPFTAAAGNDDNATGRLLYGLTQSHLLTGKLVA